LQPEPSFRCVTDIKITAVALGAVLQVCQAATPRASTQTYSVVDDRQIQPVLVGLKSYPDVPSLRMLGNIGQRFSQDGLRIGDHRFIGDRVQWPKKLYVGTRRQERR